MRLFAHLPTAALTGILFCASTSGDYAQGAELSVRQTQMVAQRVGTDAFTAVRLDLLANRDEFSLPIRVGGKQQFLRLHPHSLRSAGFRVRVQGANGVLREIPAPPIRTFRGDVQGVAGSHVELSIVGHAIRGQVVLDLGGEQTWLITPANRILPGADPREHLIYRQADVDQLLGTCATPAIGRRQLGLTPSITMGLRSTNVMVCEIACDADFEYYTLNNSSVVDTVADIELLLNAVSEIYERDLQISFAITEIIVRIAEPDPYASTDPTTLLWEFHDDWLANHGDIQRDVAQLFTGKDLAGTKIGIAFGSPGICSTGTGYNVVQAHWTTTFAGQVAVSAHELGHNFDAGHCDFGDWWCRIMCANNGGCAGRNSFSPWAIDIISNYASGRTCLDPSTAELDSTTFPFFDDFDYTGNLDPARWTGVDGPFPSTSGGQEPSPNLSIKLNEYDSFRTLPMAIDRPAVVSYWTNHDGVEATTVSPTSKSLRVEYFNNMTWRWEELDRAASDGIDTPQFDYYEFAMPHGGYGQYAAIRFSGWGAFIQFDDAWYVDDVRIDPVYYAGDVDADDLINAGDIEAFADCLAGPQNSSPPVGCDAAYFDRADMTEDGDVDLADYMLVQAVFGNGPECGNGLLEAGEWCDDGGESLFCNADCTLAWCGDGVVNAAGGEECDDIGESAACDIDCTLAVCGDLAVNMLAGEECDDGSETASCDADCTFAFCGDATTNATRGEECDDGGNSPFCDANCTFAICGDHTFNNLAGEDCDDGGETASCDVDCTVVECGDGTLNTSAGEQCDDGNTVGGDGCSALCTLSEPLPSCLIDFDTICPDDVTPVCGGLFTEGEGICVTDFPNCMDSLPQSFELEYVSIALSGDVLTLSVAFWGDNVGGEFSQGSMDFYDADWNYVDSLPSDNCFFGQPPVRFMTFVQPVRFIEVYAETGPLWIDSMWINP